MYEVECKNIGMAECTYVGKGATIEEVKQKALAHARIVHKDVLASMTPRQLEEMDRLLTSKIRQLA
jgi:predicted small metal-binding protein